MINTVAGSIGGVSGEDFDLEILRSLKENELKFKKNYLLITKSGQKERETQATLKRHVSRTVSNVGVDPKVGGLKLAKISQNPKGIKKGQT